MRSSTGCKNGIEFCHFIKGHPETARHRPSKGKRERIKRAMIALEVTKNPSVATNGGLPLPRVAGRSPYTWARETAQLGWIATDARRPAGKHKGGFGGCRVARPLARACVEKRCLSFASGSLATAPKAERCSIGASGTRTIRFLHRRPRSFRSRGQHGVRSAPKCHWMTSLGAAQPSRL